MRDQSYSIRAEVLRVKDMPEQVRPREEFARLGAEHVSDVVLLALILRTGTTGLNVVEVAQRLLSRFGSLTALAKASMKELQEIDSVGPVKAQMIKASMELAQRLTRESIGERPVVITPEQAAAVLRERARLLDHEVFWTLYLDARNRLIGEPVKVFEGGLSSSVVDPRKIFKQALEQSAAAILVAHNHPSGETSPSAEDIKVTKQLVSAGRVMGIRVLDHIIVGHRRHATGSDFLSLREAGLIDFQ